MDNFFDILQQNDLIQNNKINDDKIKKMSSTQILDIAQETLIASSMKSIKPEKSIFAHSASISLAGGRHPCRELDCRIKHLNRLVQFSTLYSDRVYIANFFSDYDSHDNEIIIDDEDDLKLNFRNDLTLFLYLRPLILSGNIILVTPPTFYCPHCLFNEYTRSDKGESRYLAVQQELIERYNKEIEYTALLEDGQLKLDVNGSKKLVEHRSIITYTQMPDAIKNNQTFLSRLETGGRVRLSRKMVQEIGQDEAHANHVFKNIIFDLSTSQCLGTSFLTERNIDIETLQKISPSFETQKRNQIIQKHLTCLVPAIENIAPSDLLKLRHEEEDAFLIFRGALNKTIDEYIKNKEDFSEQDAKAIYSDIIQPQLSKLNITVRDSKIANIKKSSTKFISWGGAITLGLYAGFLPAELVAAATALGLVPLIAELMNDVISLSNGEKEIRKEDFYFLWKATR